MEIIAENISRKFGKEWIFRSFSHTFSSGKGYAITGNNGSGKSTLMMILAGIQPVSKGSVIYKNSRGSEIDQGKWYEHLAYVGPYTELIEELTLEEAIKFHGQFKTLTHSVDDIISALGFEKSAHKQVHNFSSGMKQKLKLALAAFCSSEIIFLDEPTSNLDENNILWYISSFSKLVSEKMIFIASNQKEEYAYCDEVLNITNFKQ